MSIFLFVNPCVNAKIKKTQNYEFTTFWGLIEHNHSNNICNGSLNAGCLARSLPPLFSMLINTYNPTCGLLLVSALFFT